MKFMIELTSLVTRKQTAEALSDELSTSLRFGCEVVMVILEPVNVPAKKVAKIYANFSLLHIGNQADFVRKFFQGKFPHDHWRIIYVQTFDL